mmetsp:Transcript_40955/g.129425  ORF Transcript_40955/g.129425 Transcript_40955/m.129425 type:complete len:358 (+) Transcript_40955:87-1160(+)
MCMGVAEPSARERAMRSRRSAWTAASRSRAEGDGGARAAATRAAWGAARRHFATSKSAAGASSGSTRAAGAATQNGSASCSEESSAGAPARAMATRRPHTPPAAQKGESSAATASLTAGGSGSLQRRRWCSKPSSLAASSAPDGEEARCGCVARQRARSKTRTTRLPHSTAGRPTPLLARWASSRCSKPTARAARGNDGAAAAAHAPTISEPSSTAAARRGWPPGSVSSHVLPPYTRQMGIPPAAAEGDTSAVARRVRVASASSTASRESRPRRSVASCKPCAGWHESKKSMPSSSRSKAARGAGAGGGFASQSSANGAPPNEVHHSCTRSSPLAIAVRWRATAAGPARASATESGR